MIPENKNSILVQSLCGIIRTRAQKERRLRRILISYNRRMEIFPKAYYKTGKRCNRIRHQIALLSKTEESLTEIIMNKSQSLLDLYNKAGECNISIAKMENEKDGLEKQLEKLKLYTERKKIMKSVSDLETIIAIGKNNLASLRKEIKSHLEEDVQMMLHNVSEMKKEIERMQTLI